METKLFEEFKEIGYNNYILIMNCKINKNMGYLKISKIFKKIMKKYITF